MAGKRTDSEWRPFSFGLQYSQISCPPPPFFENPAYASVCDKSLQKIKSFHIDSTLSKTSLQILLKNRKVAQVTESFPILGFVKVTFRNLSIFGQYLI